jgi:signal transduction histidine kinase
MPTLGTGAARGTLGEIAALIDTGLEEAQATVSALREQTGEPIANAIQRHVEVFERQRGIQVDLDLAELPHLSPRIGGEMLRVVQEAMSNAARHADATRISVGIRIAGGMLVVEVRDNGMGFDPQQSSGGFGLTSMRERVESLGGEFSIQSEPSAGSTVHARVPIDD